MMMENVLLVSFHEFFGVVLESLEYQNRGSQIGIELAFLKFFPVFEHEIGYLYVREFLDLVEKAFHEDKIAEMTFPDVVDDFHSEG